jgi:hypothetical protein
MGHKKSIGLKGGPNEYITDIFEFISIEGYKRNSPDVNNPVNIIESSNITMEGVDFPVRGYGNNGIIQDMIPGVENYNYGNADYVVEMPMAQDGVELNKKYIDSTFNANMDKRWVQRLYEKNPEFYLEGQTDPSTHFMESGDSMVYPLVVEGDDGNLMLDRQEGRSQGIKFPTDEIAQWFAENYKDGTDVLKEKQRGGGLLNKTMKCNSCGWSWKAADGGSDVSTCHKCGGSALPKAQDGGCTSCTESMRQKEGSYNKGKEYILDPRFKQKGGSIKNEETIYKDYINGDYKTSEEELLGQKVYDKLNRVYYRDAKKSNMSTANYIMTHILGNS